MKARTVKIVALSAALIVGIAVVAASVWVWRVAQSVSFLDDPYVSERVRVPLEKLELPPADAVAGDTVDLGYATFRHPEGDDFILRSLGAGVVAESPSLKVGFMPPFDPRAFHMTIPELDLDSSFLDYEVQAERTQPRSLAQLLLMTPRARGAPT